MASSSVPKHLKEIISTVNKKLKQIKQPNGEIIETQQIYHDEVFMIYQEAFKKLIEGTVTYSKILKDVKDAYENSLQIRDNLITQYKTHDIFVMDDLQVERWLREVETEDEEVIESEDDEVQPEPDLQALVRESERENEEERLSESDETSSSEDAPLSELATRRHGAVYKSTNGTIWQKDVPPATRTRPQNIRIRPPGPKGDAARNAKDPLSCFELFFTQDILDILKLFGISARKNQRDDIIKNLLKETEDLKDQNIKLMFEIQKLKKDMGKLKDDQFSDYLCLMRERDARYTLYFENLGLQMKLKELDGSSYLVDEAYGDPVVLRIALDKCREQLTKTQTELKSKTDEFADTVPRRDYDALEARHGAAAKGLLELRTQLMALEDGQKRLLAQKKNLEEELFECKERCRELERAGTPRPHWDLCADFISGGRDRWRQLARGLASRAVLRVLLRELGPAARSDHLEHFDGLGLDPSIPPYLRYEGQVRNLRLSRREVCVIVNDIWQGKEGHPQLTMQDYVTKYFEDRYQQPSMRADWAYNMCAGAEQMLDEPQVKLFWGVLHGLLCERIYWGLSQQYRALRQQLHYLSKDKETVTIEELEKAAKTLFPLKSDVDIKNIVDVVRKQLKMKLNTNEVNLDKLFQENEEGFDRVELARELYRQRQLAQDKYIREIVSELGGKHAANRPVSVEGLKRALAIVDPAIDHIRMERYIRWAFSDQSADLASLGPLPLRAVAARLAAGDVERVGPRYRATRRTYK